MKTITLLIAAILSGCATSYRIDPSKISVAVGPTSAHCGENDNEVRAVLMVKNEGRAVLTIGVDGKSGPPFDISWLYYVVLDDSGKVDWKHGPGGHGPMPPSTLRIGPGDSTSVSASIYQINTDNYSQKFRIKFEDLEGHSYTTSSFIPCISS